MLKIFPLSIILLTGLLHAAPTESRNWTATSGHKTEARALSATITTVTLELASGKSITLPLEKLIPADRKAILDHFGIKPPKEGDPIRSEDTPLSADGLDYKIGQTTGNIQSAPGSHFHIYLPKTLKTGRPAPVLHYNNSGQISPQNLSQYIPACERFGWILVASAESSNKNNREVNLRHATNNIKMLRENPLVDPERIYFTGNSGGGAQSWINWLALQGAGTLPNIGYPPNDMKRSKGHHFVTGGARDYNRYLSAYSASIFEKDAIYRAFPGAHAPLRENWIIEEGIAWLTAKYLHDKEKDPTFANQRLDFEAATIDWIAELSSSKPHLAYHIAKMMQDTYGISGKNGDIIAKSLSTLAQDPTNPQFSEGLLTIHELGTDSMAANGNGTGSAYGKNYPDISRKATTLAEKFAGIPFVEQTLKELAEPTISPKR